MESVEKSPALRANHVRRFRPVRRPRGYGSLGYPCVGIRHVDRDAGHEHRAGCARVLAESDTGGAGASHFRRPAFSDAAMASTLGSG